MIVNIYLSLLQLPIEDQVCLIFALIYQIFANKLANFNLCTYIDVNDYSFNSLMKVHEPNIQTRMKGKKQHKLVKPQTHTHKHIQTDRRTYKHTNRQTNKHTCIRFVPDM